jgi:hypothetical protein
MTKTTPRGSGTISADEGNEVIEVLTCSRGKISIKTQIIKFHENIIHISFIQWTGSEKQYLFRHHPMFQFLNRQCACTL